MMHTKTYKGNNDDVNLALLQMRSRQKGAGQCSPTTLLFNRPVRVLLLQTNRKPINLNADDEHYEALKTCQDKYSKVSNT